MRTHIVPIILLLIFEKGREVCLVLDSRHRGDSKVKWSDSAVFGKFPSSLRLLKELLEDVTWMADGSLAKSIMSKNNGWAEKRAQVI